MKIFALAVATLALLPASAQTPSAQYETLPLGHAVPREIVKQKHWDDASQLPKGVKWIKADDAHNTLIVLADPAGLAQVKNVVRTLDIQPREVEIRGYFVRATQANLKASGIKFGRIPLPLAPGEKKARSTKYGLVSSGDATAAYFQKLLPDKAHAVQAPLVRTTNNFPATIFINSQVPETEADGTLTYKLIFHTGFTVKPCLNPDGTLTLDIRAASGNPEETTPLTALRTIRPDEMILLFGGMKDADGNSLALFLTASEPTDKPVKS